MVNSIDAKRLSLRIARWSDANLTEAHKFAPAYAKLSSSQLYGLANIVRCAAKAETIMQFLAHQADKAKRANRPDLLECWEALQRKMALYHEEATMLARELQMPLAIEEIYRRMLQCFVQHLIGASFFPACPGFGAEPARTQGAGSQKNQRSA